jgi:hypothetical protein
LTSSSSQAEEKQDKEKKNHKEEKNVEKGRSFPSSSHFALSLLVLTFALLSQTLSLGIFFFPSKKKKTKEKKIIKKKKNAKREGTFL